MLNVIGLHLKKNLRRSLVLGTVLIMAFWNFGCSNLDFGPSPFARVSDATDSGKPYLRQADPEVEQRQRQAQLTQTLEAWKSRGGTLDEDYVIGSGDELRIEVLSLESLGETTVLDRSVSRDGNVVLPWVGELTAAGRSPAEFEKAIADAYRGKVLNNPQVAVRVVEYRSSAVVVTGAVNSPGIYYLKRRSVSVLEVLSMSGGLSDAAGDELLIMKGGGAKTGGAAATTNLPVDVISAINLRSLIEDGDMRLNVSVEHGDVLSVPAELKEYVYVLGYVRAPGARLFDSTRGVTALNALAMAGGLASQGRAQKSFLVREVSGGGRRVIPLDLAKIARGVRPDVDLVAGDTLVVGSTFLLKISEFIRPTVGAGMNYSPVP